LGRTRAREIIEEFSLEMPQRVSPKSVNGATGC
jgi:hypothetical protein